MVGLQKQEVFVVAKPFKSFSKSADFPGVQIRRYSGKHGERRPCSEQRLVKLSAEEQAMTRLRRSRGVTVPDLVLACIRSCQRSSIQQQRLPATLPCASLSELAKIMSNVSTELAA